MNYKKAFKCAKCPQSNTEDGCPMWWEFMTMDISSKKEELKKMCGYQALPTFLTEVIAASNRPAAEMGAMREEVKQTFAAVSHIALMNSMGPQDMQQGQLSNDDSKKLESDYVDQD